MNQDDHYVYTLREWQQPQFREFFDKANELAKIETIYDIGACVGAWSVLARMFTKAQRIDAFEPDADNVAYMQNVITDPKIHIHDFGIYYGKTQEFAYGCGDSNVGGQFLGGIHSYGEKTGKVFNLKRLEELDLPQPNLIKMDIEGAEKNIIKNSPLLHTTPLLLVEWHFPQESAPDYFSQLPHKIVHELDNTMYLLAL